MPGRPRKLDKVAETELRRQYNTEVPKPSFAELGRRFGIADVTARKVALRLLDTKPKQNGILELPSLTSAAPASGAPLVAIEMSRRQLEELIEPARVASEIMQQSTRQRVLRVLTDAPGSYGSVGALMQDLEALPGGSRDTLEAVVGALWSLQRQGMATFRESKRGAGGGSKLGLIEATKQALSQSAPDFQMRVLRAICSQGSVGSSVGLAADIWEGLNDDATHPRVRAALEALNRQNYIVYKEGPPDHNGREVYLDIRPTDPKGWNAGGFPVPSKQLQNSSGSRPMGWSRPRHAIGVDMTEARNVPGKTTGGPIIKERYDEHRLRFPLHPHPPLETTPFPEEAVAAFEAEAPSTSIQVEPPTPVEAPAPKPTDPADYPLLAGLEARYAQWQVEAGKAEAYLTAAAALEAIDPEESNRLLEKASSISELGFSDMEREYFRFAKTARRW